MDKFELRIFDDSGKGPDIVIRGGPFSYDIRSEYDDDPSWNDVGGYPRYRLVRRWIEFRGDLKDWQWNQGRPTWQEDIPEGSKKEADSMRVRGGVREGSGGPEDQGGVRDAEGPVG